jgi:uncharacterized membrane protein
MTDINKQTSSIPRGIAGLLAYFIPFFGGLFFLIIEKENRLIRFHAVQSILLWIVFIVLAAIFSLIPFVNVLVYVFILAVWVFAMYQALMERMYELPIIGELSKRQAFGKEDEK